MRKVRLRVAITLDGFIADSNGGVDWLHRFHAKHGRRDYGRMREFFHGIDTVLMGRRTHDFAVSHGMKRYSGMDNFVFTRSKPPGERDGVEYTSGDPAELVAALRQKPGKDIWLCGGGDLASQILRCKLVDEISLAVIPILLGDGIPLFRKGAFADMHLQLVECQPYATGVVSLRYAVLYASVSS